MNPARKTVECIIPILKVQDLSASLDFYVNILGFERDGLQQTDALAMAGISRDHCAIYLCQGAQGNSGTWIWIGVENVRTLYEDYKARQVTIMLPPTNYSWAYEMRIRDPDGHVLRFGWESVTGVPVHD